MGHKKEELLGVAFNRLMRMDISTGDHLKTWRYNTMKVELLCSLFMLICGGRKTLRKPHIMVFWVQIMISENARPWILLAGWSNSIISSCSTRVLAFSTVPFHLRQSWACSVHFMSFIIFRSILTSSSHRDLGLPTGLPVNGYHLCIFFTILYTFQNTNLVHNSFNLQQYICYTTLLNMFRAACCSKHVEECSVTYILLKIKRIVH